MLVCRRVISSTFDPTGLSDNPSDEDFHPSSAAGNVRSRRSKRLLPVVQSGSSKRVCADVLMTSLVVVFMASLVETMKVGISSVGSVVFVQTCIVITNSFQLKQQFLKTETFPMLRVICPVGRWCFPASPCQRISLLFEGKTRAHSTESSY